VGPFFTSTGEATSALRTRTGETASALRTSTGETASTLRPVQMMLPPLLECFKQPRLLTTSRSKVLLILPLIALKIK
jgi:hypothetical protein